MPIKGIDPEQLESNSQAGQDLFVVSMLQGKKNGTFLEIGSADLKLGNNTYLLEKTFGWSGYGIDLVDIHEQENDYFWSTFYNNVKDPAWPSAGSLKELPTHIQEEMINVHAYHEFVPDINDTWANARPRTKFIKHDALTLDYSFLSGSIDYLQVDIDPPLANLEVLKILLSKANFAVITFEHDLWRNTEETRYVRDSSRILLAQHGYVMVANDITIEPVPESGINDEPIYFEDWYANPALVPRAIIDTYRHITDQLYPKYYHEILFS